MLPAVRSMARPAATPVQTRSQGLLFKTMLLVLLISTLTALMADIMCHYIGIFGEIARCGTMHLHKYLSEAISVRCICSFFSAHAKLCYQTLLLSVFRKCSTSTTTYKWGSVRSRGLQKKNGSYPTGER